MPVPALAAAAPTASRRCARWRARRCRGRSSISPMAAPRTSRRCGATRAAFDDIELLPRPLNGAADARSVDHAVRQAAEPAGHHRADRPCRAVLAGRRALRRARGAGGRHRLSASATARSARSRSWRRPAPRRAGCRSSSTRTAASPASWPSARRRRGYDALVLTIDNQLLGNRERDIRNGFTIPPRFGLAGLAGMALKADWLWRMRSELKRITFGNYVRPGESSRPQDARRPHGLAARSVDVVERCRRPAQRSGRGPLHPQGHPASRRGARGGRARRRRHHRLQPWRPPARRRRRPAIDALPAIVEAVGGRIPVLIDGGIRRGGDVVKALALGATACLIGRPQLWGLAVAGEAGVAHVLEIYRREIDRVMGLCGVTRIADIDRDPLASANDMDGTHDQGSAAAHHPAQLPAARAPTTIAAFAGVPTGHAVDAMGGRGALDYRIKPLAPADVGAGRRRHHLPLRAGRQSRAVRGARDRASPATSWSPRPTASPARRSTGDLLIGMARTAASLGLVTDGLVRDVAGILARRPAGLLRRRHAQLAGAQRPGHGRPAGRARRRHRRIRRHRRRRQ